MIRRLPALCLVLLLGCDGPPAGPSREPPPRAPPTAAPGPGETAAPWGGLGHTLLGGSDGAGGGDGPLVVMLHGYGAPGDDLVGVATNLDVPASIRFLLLHAPLSLGGGARAWWHLDPDRLAHGVDARDLSGELPDGMEPARDRVLAAIAHAREELGVESSRIAVVGFSQGAMLACEVTLHAEPPLAAAASLSGTLVSADRWAPRVGPRRDTAVFLAHGRNDTVLPFRMSERLAGTFEAGGATVTWVPFDGGHTIPAAVLERLAEFLRRELR